MSNPKTPVLVGVAQVLQRTDDLDAAKEPLELMVDAVERAAEDAGSRELLRRAGAVRVIRGVWKYGDPGRVIAERVGCPGAQTAITPFGGNFVQTTINRTSLDIQSGAIDIAIVHRGVRSDRRMRDHRDLPGCSHGHRGRPSRLLGDGGRAQVQRHRPRPVVQIRSDDDMLLSLPWELLHLDERFLVRDGLIDLVRTTLADAAGRTLLREPKTPFKLVVNVSAPEDSGLHYEAEAYRITLATAERCQMAPTELGTLEDLIDTVYREAPTGIHFSGHGMPGALLFENDEGGQHLVPVAEVVERLRQRLPDDRRVYHAAYRPSKLVARGHRCEGHPEWQ